jgi:hypothetical protein
MTELFGKQNILFLKADDLNAHPEASLNKCFTFLGLTTLVGLTECNDNTTLGAGQQRYLGLDKLFHQLPLALRQQIDPSKSLRAKAKRLLGKKRWVAPSPDQPTLARLRDTLAPDTEFYRSIPSHFERVQPSDSPCRKTE